MNEGGKLAKSFVLKMFLFSSHLVISLSLLVAYGYVIMFNQFPIVMCLGFTSLHNLSEYPSIFIFVPPPNYFWASGMYIYKNIDMFC